MKIDRLPLIIFLLFSTSYLFPQKNANSENIFEIEAEKIISKMTLEEKASQMLNASIALYDYGLDEYNWPTYEACEIHSMSMEFFTYPWMDLFFEHETDKYKFAHLASAIKFLPYGVAVDEFQHFVYENPTITSKERNEAWRKIERKYLPHIDYGDNLFLKNGGFWQKQSHIFSSPFYYIDYTLAQVCAFQFWKKDQENHTSAWNDYINLCQAGGSQSFLNLVKLANLMSPFQEDCVKSVIGTIKSWLDSVDDSKF